MRDNRDPTKPPDVRISPITEDRINAVLRTLTTEREIDFDHAAWAKDHGVAMASV